MYKSSIVKSVLFIAFVAAGTSSFAQKAADATWKKRVVRVIDISQKTDDKLHHLRDAGADSLLTEMLVSSILAGKIIAYASWETQFLTTMSIANVKEYISPMVDTTVVVDPVTGTEKVKVIKTDFNYEAIKKLRILEDWTFDPIAGKTDIQIVGIAPVQDVYGNDGVYRGSKGMFWLKYNDVRSIIARYERYHPDNTIAAKIWYDYFLSDTMPAAQK